MPLRKMQPPPFAAYYLTPQIAGGYDRARASTWKKQVIRQIERELFTGAVNRAPRVLELGAGTGEITRALAAYSKVTGVDISPAMLDEARKKLPPGSAVTFRCIDMFRLRDDGETFDAIAACRVFLHLKPAELAKMLDICRELLSPGGRLVFDLQRPSLWRRILARIESGKVQNPDYSQEVIKNLLGSKWTLEEDVAIDHWLPLMPLVLFRGEAPQGVINFFTRLEQKLASYSLFACRWVLVCRRNGAV